MRIKGGEGQVSGEYTVVCGVDVELWNQVFVHGLCRWVSLIESREHNTVFISILVLPEQDCNKTNCANTGCQHRMCLCIKVGIIGLLY